MIQNALEQRAAEERRRARREARTERSRREILAAAWQLLAERRVPSFTVEEVARAAGVSPPAVYYYFRSKEEIMGALMADAARASFEVQIAAVERAATGAEALEAMIRAFAAHYSQNLHAYRLEFLWSQMYGVPREVLEEIVYKEGDRLFGLVESKLIADARAGRLAPEANPRRLAFAAWLASHGLVGSRALFDAVGARARHSFEDQLEEICALVTRGASARGARPPGRKRKGKKR